MPSVPVVLKSGGLALDNWDSLTVTRSLTDMADAFAFTCQSRPELLKAFKPRGFQSCEVWFKGQKIITGTVEHPEAQMSTASLNIQGRSLTGAMVDSNIRGAVQFGNQTLGSIGRKIAEPFGVVVALPQGDSASLGDRVVASDSDTAAGFLQRLAESMGWLWHSNTAGQLELFKPVTKSKPVASLIEGQGLFLDCTFGADGTKMFSEFRIVQQIGWPDAVVGVALDPSLPYRPHVSTGNPGSFREVTKAAEQARGFAIAAGVSATAEVGDWTTDDGTLWEPGQYIEVTAPSVWISSPILFLISAVTLTLEGGTGRRASLTLVLPGTYSGEVPGVWPWD